MRRILPPPDAKSKIAFSQPPTLSHPLSPTLPVAVSRRVAVSLYLPRVLGVTRQKRHCSFAVQHFERSD